MEFITDRTEADVLLGTAKGQYGPADLNRVERDVEQLAAAARALGLGCALTTKTDWGQPGPFDPDAWPTAAQMERYLGNVAALCDLFGQPCNLPPNLDHLTWEGANAIEQALQRVHTQVRRLSTIYRFSGELYAGEEEGL